jgi:hypothetical protein
LKNSEVIFDGLGKISQKPQKCPEKKFGSREAGTPKNKPFQIS